MTTMFAALDRFTALCADALPEVQVTCGWNPEEIEYDENGFAASLETGWLANGLGVENDVTTPGASNARRETYRINSTLNVECGGTDLAPIRERIRVYYTAVDEALRADHTLGGLVMSALPAFVDFEQGFTTEGSRGVLTLSVVIQAFGN